MANSNEHRPRLGEALGALAYDRAAHGVGIVHLGIGAFHRAHQAVYTDDVLAKEGGDWKITGVSLRSAGVRDQLNPQQGLFTLVEMGEEGTRHRLIGSIDGVLVAREDPRAVLDAMVADSCRIYSLTVTEKGYCHDPATGRLNTRHPDIVHDLSQPRTPNSAIGYIVEALRERRARGASVPTVLCCDNLPSNGSTLKRLAIEYALELDEGLAKWIDEEVPFPDTMVDRIVPATRPEDIEELERACGYLDTGMVKAELFSQWVIEDAFSSGRPAWETVGASLVDDVEPYEVAKLRMLNGSHSSLAYLGFLAGYEYVHEVMDDSGFRQFISRLMAEEIAPTLVTPEGLDPQTYARELLDRFANTNLMHTTYQIAMDGSQKLPQRLLGTVRDRLAARQPIEHLSLAIAGWIRYVMGFDEQGRTVAVQDPMAERFARIADDSYNAADNLFNIEKLVDGFLSVADVFGDDLPRHGVFRARLTHWLGNLLANGAATTVKVLLLRLTPQPRP